MKRVRDLKILQTLEHMDFDDDGNIHGLYDPKTNLEDALMEVLRFCGCGMPEDALLFLEQHMRLILDNQNAEEPDARTQTFNAMTAALPDTGMRYFVWYVLDSLKFTEHGGSVPGWLSDKGKDFLEALDYWKAMK